MRKAQPLPASFRPIGLTIAALLLLSAADLAFAQLGAPTAEALRNRRGFLWDSTETGHFRFYFESAFLTSDRRSATERRAEESGARVLALLGDVHDTDHVSVFVLSSREKMKVLTGKEVNGLALPAQRVVLYVINDTVDASGAHELCHVFAKASWGNAADWINEGLAVYADDAWQGHALHAAASYLLEQRKLVPIVELLNRFDKQDELVAYPEAGSFVKFLYETYGAAVVKQTWSGGAAALQRVTGKRLDALEREWHARITTRAGPS